MRKLAALRNRSPFAGDQPLDSISLCVYGDSTGLRYWNGNNDPMPIKTLNNNGLKVYEETEDYFIQIDKDAVITTVEKYVPGTFDIYNERLKDVERSRELLSLHKITWDANIDNAKLLLDINKEQLEKLANTPTLLENEEMPVLKTRTIPTNYECCVRTDKKTGEMYIGEGYENLYIQNQFSVNHRIQVNILDSHTIRTEVTESNVSNYIWYNNAITNTLKLGSTYNISWKVYDNDGFSNVNRWKALDSREPEVNYNIDSSLIFKYDNNYVGNQVVFSYDYVKHAPMGSSFKVRTQITKTSAPKPFVKTIIPNGKLEFLSDATEKDHTFLTKGDGVITFGSGSFSLKGEKIVQLLVYEGLLTEQEKQTELAKDIKLK